MYESRSRMEGLVGLSGTWAKNFDSECTLQSALSPAAQLVPAAMISSVPVFFVVFSSSGLKWSHTPPILGLMKKKRFWIPIGTIQVALRKKRDILWDWHCICCLLDFPTEVNTYDSVSRFTNLITSGRPAERWPPVVYWKSPYQGHVYQS